MKYLILLPALLMSSCTAIIPEWEVTNSIEFCKEHGGIYAIQTNTIFYNDLTCRDGTYTLIKKILE